MLSRQSESGGQVCHTNWLPTTCLLFREAMVAVEREAGLLLPCVTGLYSVAQKIGEHLVGGQKLWLYVCERHKQAGL